MYSKRVFTKNNYNVNYKDYNTIKSGSEILKAIKLSDNDAKINQFQNYNSWQTLSSSYYKYYDTNSFNISYIKKLYDSNESFIDEKCESIINNKGCSSENNILYPYGNIISKKYKTPYFPSNILLCKWCNKRNSNEKYEDLFQCQKAKESNICNCEYSKIKIKRKPLFI